MTRRLSLTVVALLLVSGVAFWHQVVEPIRRHGKFYRAVGADLESLAKKRPSDVSRKQWESVVAWTLNAHANCFGSHHRIPSDEMARFEAELKRRLAEPVDLATIDWIWDEIVRLTPGGQRY